MSISRTERRAEQRLASRHSHLRLECPLSAKRPSAVNLCRAARDKQPPFVANGGACRADRATPIEVAHAGRQNPPGLFSRSLRRRSRRTARAMRPPRARPRRPSGSTSKG